MTTVEEQAARRQARCMGTLDVLARLRAESPEAFAAARVVGRWVWCEFTAKPSAACRTVLSDLGFYWNRKRGAWQHPCGRFSKRAPYDPRLKYGQTSASLLLVDDVSGIVAESAGAA